MGPNFGRPERRDLARISRTALAAVPALRMRVPHSLNVTTSPLRLVLEGHYRAAKKPKLKSTHE